jgi:hypothetical protein
MLPCVTGYLYASNGIIGTAGPHGISFSLIADIAYPSMNYDISAFPA